MDSSFIILLGIIKLICNPEGYLGSKINFVRHIFPIDFTWKTSATLFSGLRTQ